MPCVCGHLTTGFGFRTEPFPIPSCIPSVHAHCYFIIHALLTPCVLWFTLQPVVLPFYCLLLCVICILCSSTTCPVTTWDWTDGLTDITCACLPTCAFVITTYYCSLAKLVLYYTMDTTTTTTTTTVCLLSHMDLQVVSPTYLYSHLFYYCSHGRILIPPCQT